MHEKTKKKVPIPIEKDEEDNKLMHKRLMCNYFSIGIESRIGMGFDKKRTGSACCNKTKYF